MKTMTAMAERATRNINIVIALLKLLTGRPGAAPALPCNGLAGEDAASGPRFVFSPGEKRTVVAVAI
jgi:hypothetical protein